MLAMGWPHAQGRLAPQLPAPRLRARLPRGARRPPHARGALGGEGRELSTLKCFQKEIRKSCREDYRTWVDAVVESIRVADEKQDSSAVQVC